MTEHSGNPAGTKPGARLSEQALREALGDAADFAWLEIHDSISSTNDRGKALGMANSPGFTAVFAERQESGRGRLDRPFFSPPGTGLYMSVLLRPTLPATLCRLLTPLAGVAVCLALESVFPGICPGIKWVNDVYFGEKKLCGILTESAVAPGGRLAYAVVGIGVNVGRMEFPPPLDAVATSLCNEGYGEGEPFLRERIGAAILRELLSFEKWLTSPEKLYDAYRSRLFLLGRRLAVYATDGSFLFEGYAEELERDFSLCFRDDAGGRHLLTAGEVSLKLRAE